MLNTRMCCSHRSRRVMLNMRRCCSYPETTKMLLYWTQNCVPVIDHQSIFMLNIRMYCSHRSCNAEYIRLCCSHWSWRLKMFLCWTRESVAAVDHNELCWTRECFAAIYFFKLNASICTAATDQIMLSTILYCSSRSWRLHHADHNI